MAASPTATVPPTYPEKPSRPLGVAILAVLVGIFGVLLIIGGILLLALGVTVHFLGIGSGFLGLASVIVGAVVLIIGLIILGIALGLWHLRLWALVLALLFTFFELVSLGLAGTSGIESFGFIFSLIIFVYLLAVHRHFH
jgi:hypothetical protein